ncbi:hypothetical protein Plim_4257 (plasmid) [Planctopirus limnophila DSM 3776]|uniref:Phage protein, HK97 gp10 family n=1 Tax=Planctopirus limnophila (strain ATCC 43296 / DSM 3776 / IFAM 1008 / Mu 290) TaxID=521674 RepID=D5SZE4_PLAL2|nr:hypothetical protein [Planctopirus limnophila]ADG70064.1 hypothetical protein Plim_4257 [Planctopirus limnophila DSM 3776]
MSAAAALGRQLLLELSGDRQLLKTFDRLSTTAQAKAARRGLAAGLKVVTKAQKNAVPSVKTKGHSTKRLKAGIRGRQMRVKKANLYEAKSGVNVGKRSRRSKYSQAKGNLSRAPHLHLFVLGTQPRFTGSTSRKVRGQSTGTRKDGTAFVRGKHKPGTIIRKQTGKPKRFRGRMPGSSFLNFAQATSLSATQSAVIDAMRQAILTEATKGK